MWLIANLTEFLQNPVGLTIAAVVFVLVFITALVFVALLVLLARKALPRTETVDGKPVKNKFFLIAGVGTFCALVLFVAAAEYITRL